MSADPRTRIEGHEPERLACGGVDDLPDIDVKVVGEHCQLIDQRHIDVPERVLQQLRGLRCSRSRHGYDFVHQLAVEATATSVASDVVPPTTRGVFRIEYSVFPGSIRSGL